VDIAGETVGSSHAREASPRNSVGSSLQAPPDDFAANRADLLGNVMRQAALAHRNRACSRDPLEVRRLLFEQRP
jgi:hypothetical protein